MAPYGFQQKPITGRPPLAVRLKAARRKKQWSLNTAEERTKIRSNYLKAIEDGHYNLIPLSHRKGFIRRYAKDLGVVVTNNEPELTFTNPDLIKKNIFSPATLGKSRQLVVTSRGALLVGGIVLLVLFFAYLSYQVRQFAAPPQLTIESPVNETVVTAENVTIVGRSEPGTAVFVDDLQVSVGSDGKFSYPLVLRPGLNKIAIRAINTIKKESTQTISILFQPTPATASPNP